MTVNAYTQVQFLNDLRTITAETKSQAEILDRVRPLARGLALSKEWLGPRHRAADPARGSTLYLLHEEPDHTLAVFVSARLPGRSTPPHNHGTWAVVVGVEGAEKNTYWRRVDDGSRPGYAELAKVGEEVVGPGDVVSFLPDGIHSLVNETDPITISLHVYGKHLNYTGRSRFDPEKKTETPFVIEAK